MTFFEMKIALNEYVAKFNFCLSACPLPEILKTFGFENIVLYVKQDTDINLHLISHQFQRITDMTLTVMSQNKFVINNPIFYHFMKNRSVEQLDLKNINEKTLFIDLTVSEANVTLRREIMEKNGTYWILGPHLYQYYIAYMISLRPFLNFIHKNPNVPIFMYKRPIAPPVVLRTNFEKNVLLSRAEVIKQLKMQILPIGYFSFDYTPEELLAITSSAPSYLDGNSIRKFKDFSVGRVNYRNGHRCTAFQPEKYERTCYIVGSCVGTMGQIDEHTSASWLQKAFNNAGKQIKVENYYYCTAGEHEDLVKILFSLPVKENDIVIFEDNGSLEPRILGKVVLKTSDLFAKPHKYGEVFFDCEGAWHYNGNGAREIADELFAHISKNNYFEGVSNFDIYKGKIPEQLVEPINSYCTPRQQRAQQSVSSEYADELMNYKAELKKIHSEKFGKIGSIVMNCNPFTLGHRYLIEQAASSVKHLYIFAVEEDKSIFKFADRLELMKQGTADLENVTILPSGKFIISSITFNDYFNKSVIQDRSIDPSMDVSLFAKEIAPALNITVRFAGEEPIDKVTKQYNDTMRRILPEYGISFVEIPRKEFGEEVISASRVRKLLAEKKFDEISKLVPNTTLAFLKKYYRNGFQG